MVVEHKDKQFRVVGQGISTKWWEDIPSNRKAMVVFLGSLQDDLGEHLFTQEGLARLIGSSNRQAAHEHLKAFRESGGGGGRGRA